MHVVQCTQEVRRKLLRIRFALSVRGCGSRHGIGFGVWIFGPRLDHIVGVERRNDFSCCFAFRGEPADVIAVAVRRNQDIQLTLACCFDIAGNIGHVVPAHVLGRRGTAVVNQHVPLPLPVIKAQEEAIAESHVVHADCGRRRFGSADFATRHRIHFLRLHESQPTCTRWSAADGAFSRKLSFWLRPG